MYTHLRNDSFEYFNNSTKNSFYNCYNNRAEIIINNDSFEQFDAAIS